MRWFGHVCRRDSGYTAQRMLNTELPGRRKRRRSQRRMDVVEEDLLLVSVTHRV